LYVAQDIVYIDESGMDSREDYSYGWNAQGNRFYALKSGIRQGRVNMIAAIIVMVSYWLHLLLRVLAIEPCLKLG
jgi:hypothetical protein